MSKIDLTDRIGLPITLNGETLDFGTSLGTISSSTRTVAAMKPVAAEPNQINQPDETVLYHMYRDVAFAKDRPAFSTLDLRYDITNIPPGELGPEMVKTFGHYHPGDWPELYQVIYGEAWYLIQKRDQDNPKIILACYLVKVRSGQKIVIPPYFGHIIINPGTEDLMTANWVSNKFSSDYSLYEKLAGAAYYCYADGRIEKNPHYGSCAELKIVASNQTSNLLAASNQKPIYSWALENISTLRFLSHAEEFTWDLSKIFG